MYMRNNICRLKKEGFISRRRHVRANGRAEDGSRFVAAKGKKKKKGRPKHDQINPLQA